MSLSGMTGFGRAEGACDDGVWVWEARSVNGRNLDVKLRLPPGLDGLDAKARDACQRRFRRGSLQLGLSLRRPNGAARPALRINEEVLAFYADAGARLVERGLAEPARWDGLLALRGVVETADEIDDEAGRASRDAALLAGLEQALDALEAARRQEGASLADLLAGLLDGIEAHAVEAESAAAAQVEALRERVARRAAELLGDAGADPQRLMQEAAMLALKADVREELDRLREHVRQARSLLAGGGEIGRKLEFLAQEFHRESNTLTAKAAALPLTRAGLALKAAVDQLKEQAANVE